jgi:biotin carboxyl carrier protein
MQLIIQEDKFDLSFSEKGIFIDDQPSEMNVLSLSERKFQLIHNQKTFQVELVHYEPENKSYLLKLNGKKINVKVKDRMDVLLEKLGIDVSASAKMKDLKAPMPGLILEIKVKEGQAIKEGDQLIVLEAMKMENVIKSSGEGIIKKVLVKKGESVEKNHVLIEF